MKTFFRKKHKYNAKSIVVDGITFASRKEARRYLELKILEKEGEITDLELQPVFILQDGFERQQGKVRSIKYIADFMYLENNKRVVEDTKGIETETFKLKKKMFWLRFPEIDLRIL